MHNILENSSFSPSELAKKEATRPISLRVKEKTMLEFEKLAQQYSVTASFLINGLLDTYIETLKKDEGGNDNRVSHKVMSQYLEKLAGRVGKNSDKDLCVALAKNKDYSNVVEEYEPLEYYEGVKSLQKGIDDGYDISVFMGDGLKTEFHCSMEQKATIDHDDDNITMVLVPAKKYPIVANIMLGYVTKAKNLYGENYQAITSGTIDSIIEAINSQENRAKLAKSIASILANYEGIQDGE